MSLNVYLVLVQISICVMIMDNYHCLQHQFLDIVMLLNVYLVLVQKYYHHTNLISTPDLSKHLTTIECPDIDAINNGDFPSSSRKLISPPELSKHSTTSQCPFTDAFNNGDGHSPLFVASVSGHCDVVERLLSSGAEINLCDKAGQSPLFVASWKGECDVVECLTTSQCPSTDASNNGDCPRLVHKLISAPELSKHSTTSHSPYEDNHHC
jgi:ankyrin repeat protein